MIDRHTIDSERGAEDWAAERRRYQADFDPDLPNTYPFVVSWTEGEANGWPYIEYDTAPVEEPAPREFLLVINNCKVGHVPFIDKFRLFPRTGRGIAAAREHARSIGWEGGGMAGAIGLCFHPGHGNVQKHGNVDIMILPIDLEEL